MVDTADKTKGRLLDHLPPERIPAFVDRARSLGLKVGLSGSLEAPDIPRLLPFAPDFLGFRGALCDRSQRTAAIDAEAVEHIRSLIPEEQQADRSATVDYRLLAARGYSPGAGDPTLGTDKIFVRDFVLPVQIGAYSFEHGHTQKVRFDVTADVLRVDQEPGGHAPRRSPTTSSWTASAPSSRAAMWSSARRWPSRWRRMCWRIRASCA